MAIDNVRPKIQVIKQKKTFPNDTTPSAQGLDQYNHKKEENNDQGGDENDGEKGEAQPHLRVRQNV
jgi:hypothetical protein